MDRLNEFLKYIFSYKAVLFIGAGVSSLAGCKNWEEVCEQLIKIKIVQKKIKNKSSIEGIPKKEIITWCRQLIQSEEDRRRYDNIINTSLYYQPEKHYKIYIPFIDNVKKIEPFPKDIITTNMDTCLESSRKFDDMVPPYFRLGELTISNFLKGGIFHIHGLVEHADTQVWTLDDYIRQYDNREFIGLLRYIFSNHSVLFLGYSFGDDELRKILRLTKQETSEYLHFALIPTEGHAYINDGFYKDLFNVEIIRYGKEREFGKIFSDWVTSNFDTLKA